MRVLSCSVLLALSCLAQTLPPPEITSLSPATVTAGSPSFTLVVNGSRFSQDSRVVWRYGFFNATNLDTRFISETRLEATVPATVLQQGGTVPVAVVQGSLVSNLFDLFVASQVQITTACPLPSAIPGRTYNYTLGLTGGAPPYTWSLSAGTLPSDLILLPDGSISGTPAVSGTYNFSLRLTDSQQNTASRDCSMRVLVAQQGQTLFVTSLSPPNVLAGSPDLTLTIKGSGFAPGVVAQWGSNTDLVTTYIDPATITAVVPARLLTNSGTFPVSVRRVVLTAREVSNSEDFLVIGSPEISSACPLPDASLHQAYSQTLTATSGIPPYTWRLSQGVLPLGLNLAAGGGLTGSPTQAGTFPFTLEVTDARSNTGTRTCSLRVLGPLSPSPSSITFTLDAGGEEPPPQFLSIVTGAADVPLSFQISAPWLRSVLTPGVTPAQLELRLRDYANFAPGTYAGQITVRTDVTSNVATVPVTLIVRPARSATLISSPPAVAFASPRDSSRIVTRLVTITNPSSVSMPVTVSSTASWLSVTASANSVSANSPLRLRLRASPINLDPGTYRARVIVGSTGLFTPLAIPVTLSVAGSGELLTSAPTGIGVSVVQGGPAPAVSRLSIAGQANSNLFWEAVASTVLGDNWLSVTPPSDAARPDNPSTAEVRIDASALAPEIYFGEVAVSSPSADNSPRLTSVALQVLPPTAPLISIEPSALIFTGPASRQSVAIRNLSTTSVAIDFSVAGELRVFSITPQGSRILQPGEVRTVDVDGSPQGMPSGSYRGSLFVHASNDSRVRAVDLLYVVRPNLVCTPTRLYPVVTSQSIPYVVPAGLPLTLETRIVDSCGDALTSGIVVAGGTPLQQTRPGIWVGSYTPEPAIGPSTFTIYADDAGRNLQGSIQVSGEIVPSVAIPFLSDGGVTSAAALQPGGPLALGSLFTAYGRGLAEGEQRGPAPPWPNVLNRASLFVGAKPAPLFYAANFPVFSQLNAQLPYDLRPNTVQQVTSQFGAKRSQYVDAPVATAQPSIFTLSQTGEGQGIVVDAGRPTVIADPANPTTRGAAIVLYVEGLGAVNQSLPAGQPAPVNPLARSVVPVTVTVGGLPAEVLFAGLTPGLAGLYQINLVVPMGVTAGDAVPVIVTANGQSSNAATIAIR
ncbi:MAG: putative Ig domain-containing protein [Bryobacterales bacterium]|nr:putative Ig domain-containing protein [Bryobacterales bacterium]